MSSAYPRFHVFYRCSCLVSIAWILSLSPQTAESQSPPDQPAPLAYVQPANGAKLIPVDRIIGQVVFAPAAQKGVGSASGIRLALFDEQKALVTTVISGEEGRFEIKDVPSGLYILVAGAERLHLLSIPLQVKSAPPEDASVGFALLLTMRAETDKRKSVVGRITNQPLRAELLEMLAKDQDIRKEWIRQGVNHQDQDFQERWKAIDAQNLVRTKEIVHRYGWPGPELVGVDGTEAAFLLIQHAPQDFQEEMLPRIRTAYRAGKLTGQDYALLLDRVLVRKGKPQVYGTQTKPFAEWKNQVPAFLPIQDEAHVDRRRTEVGLPPLADYVKILKETYFPQGTSKP